MQDLLKRITFKKLKLDQFQPLAQDVLDRLEDWLSVELTYSSNAIEGNTLTRWETAEILEKGVQASVGAKPLQYQLEALNHQKALAYVRVLAREKKSHTAITESDILALHKLILGGIQDDWAGIYRRSPVFVKGSTFNFLSPQSVPYAMDEFIAWLQAQDARKEHPLLIGAEAHFRLVTVHPFVDGNGRTARLLMNLVLAIHGYPMAVIRKDERLVYLEAVQQGQMHNDLSAFYELMAQALERSLETFLAAAKGQASLTPFGEGRPPAKRLIIGEVAKQSGETAHTIRFWTKQGLLRVVGFSEGGYLLYAPEAVARARKIRQLQADKRLTLKEIKAVLHPKAG